MIYRKDGEWALAPFKVIYKQHGETKEQETHDKQWWLDFAEKWDHTEIVEFVELEYTAEQQARLAEVQHVKEAFEYYASRYVVDGLFPNQLEDEQEFIEDNPLKILQLKKENQQLGQMVTDLNIRLRMQEMS